MIVYGNADAAQRNKEPRTGQTAGKARVRCLLRLLSLEQPHLLSVAGRLS